MFISSSPLNEILQLDSAGLLPGFDCGSPVLLIYERLQGDYGLKPELAQTHPIRIEVPPEEWLRGENTSEINQEGEKLRDPIGCGQETQELKDYYSGVDKQSMPVQVQARSFNLERRWLWIFSLVLGGHTEP